MSSLAFAITPAGVSAPVYADILNALQAQVQSIYGSDLYLGADSQDGQFLAIFALAVSDLNAAGIAAYNALSPATAQGAGLSSVIKINGIARRVATASQVTVTIVGTVGTIISGGIVSDVNSNKWNLPATVIIPVSGTIDVLATAEVAGAVGADPGTVTTISTPTLGWQSVTNAQAAIAGAAVESDAQLRVRQAISTALPSLSVLEGIVGEVANLPGVLQVLPYENDTDTANAIGVPPHSICLVVEGGDPAAIASVIARKKTPGTGTYGTTAQTILDVNSVPITIKFFIPTTVQIALIVTIKALTGYLSSVGTAIQAAVANYADTVPIGGGPGLNVEWDAALTAAKSVDNAGTFRIATVTLSRLGTASGGSATTVVDSGRAWFANVWAGYTVTMISGAAAGQTATIISNTATTLTFAAMSAPNAAGNAYRINGNPDMPLAFNEMPVCAPANVTLTVS